MKDHHRFSDQPTDHHDAGRGLWWAHSEWMLHDIPALRRLAFITSHPNFLSRELISAIAELPKVSRFLHLPAQSGSNRVLKAMRRGYTVERYLDRVERLLASNLSRKNTSGLRVWIPSCIIMGSL